MTVSVTNNSLYKNFPVYFGNQNSNEEKKTQENTTPKKDKYGNPIKPGFEYLDAIKITAIAAIAFLGKVALEMDDVIPEMIDMVNDKNGSSKKGLKVLTFIGMGIAGIYFLANLPKNLYDKKKEVFVKKNEWNVYSRANSAEKNIYETMDKEAKTADEERKMELASDYLKMQTAKNQVPFSR